MSERDEQFELPGRIDRLLALLAKRYTETNGGLIAELILGSRLSIDTMTYYDGWDGGQYGHDVILEASSSVFETVMDRKDEVEATIRDDLNRLHGVPNESVQSVRIDLADDPALEAWRPGSGQRDAVVALKPPPDAAKLSRLWEPGYFRLFLSHKAEHRADASTLKAELMALGFACFVAHEDIQPTLEWQLEIERALNSMEALLALMTPGFSDSDWTDQEVGVAIGRGVPVVSVDLGQTAYGFIGKYQAVKGTGKTPDVLAGELAGLFVADPMSRRKVVEALLIRFENASGYVQANKLFRLLESIVNPPEGFMERIERAFRENDQVSHAFGVRNGMTRLRQRFEDE